jgi:hypothetical protein
MAEGQGVACVQRPEITEMSDSNHRKPLPPDEVIALAEIVEKQIGSYQLHGQLGLLADEPELPAAPPPPPAMDGPAPSVVGRSYCDECGRIGGHAARCPTAVNPEVEVVESEVLEHERPDEPEPIRPLMRRIIASALRRLADRFDSR